MESSKDNKAILISFASLQHFVGYEVNRDAENPHFKSRYASLGGIMALVGPAGHGAGRFLGPREQDRVPLGLLAEAE